MIDRTLKHYVIESQLGRGGMGTVYRARDLRLNRPVAIKVLPPELTADDERRRRFIREAQAAAAVTHPSIAQVYDVDEADGVTFIAMELVEGQTVRSLVAAQELDLLRAIDIGVQVAEGLARAHEAGIVHRDIKSDNVMVTRDGQAKILDFGLAKLVETAGAASGDVTDMPTRGLSVTATQAGMVLGTLSYMSPEQARGRAVDQRSDLFSFGVMLYEMSTGRLPFEGESPLDTMHAIAFDETRPVTEIRPGLPPELQRIVSRCLRKRPEDRYPDARALADDLKRLRADTESGRIRALPIGERLRDRWQRAAGLRGRAWYWIGIGSATLVAAVVFSMMGEGGFGALFFWAIVALLVWRRIRNRRHTLVRRFVRRTQKIAGVRMIVLHQDRLTVVVEQARAALYPRLHGEVEAINRKLYYGEPIALAIRDDLQATQVRSMLSSPGVLFVRQDVLGPAETPSRGA